MNPHDPTPEEDRRSDAASDLRSDARHEEEQRVAALELAYKCLERAVVALESVKHETEIHVLNVMDEMWLAMPDEAHERLEARDLLARAAELDKTK